MSCGVAPVAGVAEEGQVTGIGSRDDGVWIGSLQHGGVRREYHVTIERTVIRRLTARVSRHGPTLGRAKHDLGSDRRIRENTLEAVQASKPRALAGANQFTPHFVIRNLRQHDLAPSQRQRRDPRLACIIYG